MCHAEMHITLVWIGGAILGLWLLRAILCGLGRMMRDSFGGVAGKAGQRGAGQRAEPRKYCTHPGCGHLNPPAARFCARCGRSLSGATETNDYG